jgi:hypothetical protein
MLQFNDYAIHILYQRVIHCVECRGVYLFDIGEVVVLLILGEISLHILKIKIVHVIFSLGAVLSIERKRLYELHVLISDLKKTD